MSTTSEASVIAEIETACPQVITTANKNAATLLQAPLADTRFPSATLYEIADHYVQQNGETESREIYIYREGFYRGTTVALFLLAIGSLARATGNEGTALVFGITIHVTFASLLALGVTSVGTAYLCFRRFQRFAAYRVRNSIYSFIAIVSASKKPID